MTRRLRGFYDWALVGLIGVAAADRWLERRRVPLVVRGAVVVVGVVVTLVGAALIATFVPLGNSPNGHGT